MYLPLGLLSCYTKSMKKAGRVKQKVMGRPRTGTTPLMGFRADPVTRASIVRWAERQPDMPTLSEAIRRLGNVVLLGKPKGRQSNEGQRLRARELAGNAIDGMTDIAAHANDQASRKHRLIKGPEEFRESRVDRVKKKRWTE
jgi:hypothetical protein